MNGAGVFRELGRASVRVRARHVLFVLLAAGAVALAPVLGVWFVVGLLALALVAYVLWDAVEIVQAYERRPYTVLGAYRGMLGPGLNFVPPLVAETHVFDVRTQTIDVPRQEAITRDNSPVTANAVVYIRVTNAERAFLQVADYKRATSLLAQTTLRAVLGDMDLDDTLSKREEINARIHEELDEPTDEWGIRIEAVEVQEVMPSARVQSAMERQTSAERSRRAMILEAQGERQSAIEQAQGQKQSDVIRAQGRKRAQILEAQGDAVSTVLRAKSAQSMGERAVVERGMEAVERIGTAPSTTFVLPQELTSLLGRYGRRVSGTDDGDGGGGLESREFDAETTAWLGLDEIDELVSEATGDEVEIEVERPE